MSYYFYDKKSQMVLINNFQEWKNEREDVHGKGDALWRTSMAYMSNPEKKYKDGIIKAFKLEFSKNKYGYVKEYHYQARRCNPDYGIGDVSRDQVILAWTALKFNGDDKKLEEIVEHTKFKLSKRYLMTPTMWLWSRGLIGDNFLGLLGQISLSIELSFNVVYNKIIKLLIGYKEYSIKEIDKMLEERTELIRNEVLTNKWKKLLWKANYPGYALHFSAWMNFVSQKSIFKKLNNWLIRRDMSKHNLLLKLLTNTYVTDEEINNYEPHEEWLWSQRMTKMNRNLRVPNPTGKEFDKTILKTIKNKIYK